MQFFLNAFHLDSLILCPKAQICIHAYNCFDSSMFTTVMYRTVKALGMKYFFTALCVALSKLPRLTGPNATYM